MNSNSLTAISKMISHALRHEPERYNLQLDTQGWVALSDLLAALASKGIRADEQKIQELLATASKQRFELKDGRIRAFYGHSTDKKIIKEPTEPPEYLYHGTIAEFLESILAKGLLPMSRQYVHLSADTKTAGIVGKRRKGDVVILTVKAQKAYQRGVVFYQEGNGIWLADAVPGEYLTVNTL